MSRGLGYLQRRIREVLYAAEDQELPIRELRRRLGEPDRSNLRRAIRGLLERGVVEESRSSGKRRVALTVFGYVGAGLSLAPPRRPPASAAAALEEARRVLREATAAEAAARAGWVRHERRLVRGRLPGETQRRVIFVLHEYAEPVEEGLPVTVVKAIVGGDRSNARRAIRTLMFRGWLEESADGRRVRLSGFAASFMAPTLGEPVDDGRAREVLRAHHDASPTRPT
jgi:DNA-binding IclR family transcriptional regulator